MGRHSSTTRRGIRTPVILVCVALVLALLGWLTVAFVRGRLGASGCDTTTAITVTAAPDIAPVVTQAAKKASEEDTKGCYSVTVSSRDSAATAESLAVSDGTERPVARGDLSLNDHPAAARAAEYFVSVECVHSNERPFWLSTPAFASAELDRHVRTDKPPASNLLIAIF